MNTPLSRRHFLALAPLAAAAAVGCDGVASEKKEPPVPDVPLDPKAVATLAEANNAFGFDLYAKLRGDPGNQFVSPFSVLSALGMTAAGARGATLAEMRKVLHLPADDTATDAAFFHLLKQVNGPPGAKRGYSLDTANAIWGQQNFPWRAEFQKRATESYQAALFSADFKTAHEAARLEINRWVEGRTRDKIKDLVAQGVLDRDTRMVLVNAIYFKGDWLDAFGKKLTKPAPFTLADGKRKDVPMMARTARMDYAETEGEQVVRLPYKGNELSMLVALPRKPDGMADLEARLKAKTFNNLQAAEVQLSLPRFQFKASYALKPPLESLGMKLAFKFGDGDLSGMSAAEGLCISAVIHQSFVDVNEEGTEAAAATAVVVKTASARVPTPPKVFRADRPFLFAIRHEASKAILFLGRCESP